MYKINYDGYYHYSTATMDHEIACVDINPIASEDKSKSSICAVGLWTEISVRLLALPNFENIYTQPLGGGNL